MSCCIYINTLALAAKAQYTRKTQLCLCHDSGAQAVRVMHMCLCPLCGSLERWVR